MALDALERNLDNIIRRGGTVFVRPTPLRFTLASLTQAGGTATATASAAHGLSTGDIVLIEDATVSAYNGEKTVTVTGATTFTFSIAGGTASPAGGPVVYSKSPAFHNLGEIRDARVRMTSVTTSRSTRGGVVALSQEVEASVVMMQTSDEEVEALIELIGGECDVLFYGGKLTGATITSAQATSYGDLKGSVLVYGAPVQLGEGSVMDFSGGESSLALTFAFAADATLSEFF